MRYCIEFSGSRCCEFAENRKALIKRLEELKSEAATDIRKIYKSGASDSVMEKYKPYLQNAPTSTANTDRSE